jgi:hypothetical protein
MTVPFAPKGQGGGDPIVPSAADAGDAPAAPPAVPPGAADFPPLEIRHNPLLGRFQATLCCIARNESYFLPAFLGHYRALGVDRFVVLDDRSDDGSLAFLHAQPDVMVVGSPLRYGDRLDYPSAFAAEIREARAVRLWRDQLTTQFCTGQWTVVADTDEFLCLPPGTSLPDLARRLEGEGIGAVWGTMLDMYPESVADLLAAPEGAPFSLDGPWYFDARPHLRHRGERDFPRMTYPGARARLLAEAGLQPQGDLLRRLRRRLTGFRYAPTDMIYKVPFLRWEAGDFFRNCHWPAKRASTRHMLPIMHFKFTPDLPRKIDFAIASKGYNRASAGYRLYRDLLDRMKGENRPFLAPVSRRFRGWEDFVEAGIARV